MRYTCHDGKQPCFDISARQRRSCQSRREAALGVVCFLFNHHAHCRERAMAMALMRNARGNRSHITYQANVARNRLGIAQRTVSSDPLFRAIGLINSTRGPARGTMCSYL